MKKLLLLSFALILFNNCFAQNAKIDSLLNVLKTAKEDTNKVNILNNLSADAGWQVGNYDTAFYYAETAKKLAKELGFKRGIARSDNNIGVVYWYQGNYPDALENYFSSLKIMKEIGDRSGVAMSYNNIGAIYRNQGNYPEALENYSASLKIREEIRDRSGISMSYNNIGIIYWKQGNYPEALKNYFAALKIKEELGDKKGIAMSYNNIGIIYGEQGNYPEALKNQLAALKIREELGDKKGITSSYTNIGVTYMDQGNYSEALKNHTASLKISEEIGDKPGVARSYSNIGDVYAAQDNYPEVLKNYTIALKISEEINDLESIAGINVNLGALNIKLSKLGEAKRYLNNALSLSREIGYNEAIRDSYQNLAKLDSIQGNWEQAYEHHKLYNIYKDSLNNEENTKKIVQTQMQYDFDKKEAATQAEQDKKDIVAAEQLKRKTQQRNAFMGGFAVVLLFAGVFFMQRNRISKEKARSEELLLNILPAETAQELKEKGHSDAQLVDHVTVLFTDFKGFTALSEQLSPKELVQDLHACFSEFDRICAKYGIEKIKTIGDAYMAAGGLPSPNTTHAQDAVNAALEMAQVVEAGKAKKIATDQPFFEIRIGIHTGPVVAGIVGIKKFQYDIWGDTVNTASRMESSGEVGKVNISETTYELVKDQFTCEYRGEVEAKGKGKMKMYFVEVSNTNT